MLPSSRLRRFALTDDQGRRAKLADFVVELPPEGYHQSRTFSFATRAASSKFFPGMPLNCS